MAFFIGRILLAGILAGAIYFALVSFIGAKKRKKEENKKDPNDWDNF